MSVSASKLDAARERRQGDRGRAAIRARRRVRRAGPARRARRRALLLAVPAAVYLVLMAGYPLVVVVRMSVSEVTVASIRTGDWPLTGLDNVTAVIRDAAFRSAFGHTLQFLAVVLVISLVVGLGVALVVERATRTSVFVQSLLIFVWALPPLIVGSLWKFLMTSDGPVNALLPGGSMHFLTDPGRALWSVSLVVSFASVPFAMMMLRPALLGLDRDTLEAAAVDGASRWQMFRHVAFPQLLPTLLVLGLLIVMYAFRSFDFIYVLTQGGPGTASATLPYLAYQLAFQNLSFGPGSAVAVVSMLIVGVIAAAYIAMTRRELHA